MTAVVAGERGRTRPARQRLRVAPILSLAVLAALATIAVLAPWIAAWTGLDPEAPDLLNMAAPPSAAHPLGTDTLGRDMMVRLAYAARVSLTVGLLGALAATVIGTVIGLIAGFRGGAIDAFLMRATDGVIALPLLPLLIVLSAIDGRALGLPAGLVDSGQADVLRIVAIVAIVGWTTVARLVRASTLSIVRRDFVLAARGLGAGPLRIAVRHVLPNVTAPIVVATTLAAGQIILLESTLSFLGFGIDVPAPSWGNLLTDAQDQIWSAPHLAIFPGLAIFVTVVALNMLGDSLLAALDPRLRGNVGRQTRS